MEVVVIQKSALDGMKNELKELFKQTESFVLLSTNI